MNANVIGKLTRSRRPRGRAAVALLPGVFALMLVGVSGAAAAGTNSSPVVTATAACRRRISKWWCLHHPERLPAADPTTHRTTDQQSHADPESHRHPDRRWQQRKWRRFDANPEPDRHPNEHSSAHQEPGVDTDTASR